MLLINATPYNNPIEFTQGDTVTLTLIATDDQLDPINLTGASLSTQILGPNGSGPVTFPNSQHTLANQTTNPGQFTLALATTDTANLGEGANKDIITEADISSVFTYFHGTGILKVNANVPLQ